MSNLYGVTIDRIVKDDDACNIALCRKTDRDIHKITEFLLKAKKNTYASSDNKTVSCRTNSHDFCYQDNTGYQYYDTYLGGEWFSGEEAVWLHEIPVWSMNYAGRVVGENFSGDFLKEALKEAPADSPFRGPPIYTNSCWESISSR